MNCDWISIVNLILVLLGTCGTGFLVWKACQKPKASLRFANNKEYISFEPHYYNRAATKYYKFPWPNVKDSMLFENLINKYNEKHKNDNVFVLTFHFSNIGHLQIEDYRIDIEWNAGIQSVGRSNSSPRAAVGNFIELEPLDSLSFNRGKPQITFAPRDKRPLNQDDSEEFSFCFTPFEDAEKIELYWHIVAKGFSDNGKLMINLKPKITEYDYIKMVYKDSEIPEGAERIDDLKPYIEELRKKLEVQ